ncbi:ABC transporter substrate-binding protein [Nocardia zapadnayensis]|uniref:ABC transporter substrate-binding protein n=1 Tax=Nocardia rhamnosiphila TaxID=426716 RepID=UPI002246648D|nr:ABC transporter substrate-binding protein [Nocardia zapadnayensis]MCX0273141.1 ABC transporter substrate-binding protein [Nocardia zapadnayensis]
MKRTLAVGLTALCATAALTACSGRDTATASGDCDPGITDTEIRFGTSLMQSVAGAQATAATALFDEINAAGGIAMGDGKSRKIVYTAMDDGYDPARTVGNVRSLVEQDQVFAIQNLIGTASTLAVVDYLTQKNVPLVFPMTGTDELLATHDKRPVVAGAVNPQTGWEVSERAEQIRRDHPQAKIAVLYPNDSLGVGSLDALKSALEGSGTRIVAEQSYEQTTPSVDSQIVNLASSGADVFVNFATASFVTQSLKKANELNWKPDTYIYSGATDTNFVLAPAGPGAAEGIHSFYWIYDVSSTEHDAHPGVQNWRAFAERNAGKVKTTDTIAATGYNTAQLLVTALEQMKGCTRADLLDAVGNMRGVTTDLSIEGVTFDTTPDYPYVITSMAPMTFRDGSWHYDAVVTRGTEG